MISLPREEKVELVREIREDVERSSGFLLTDYRGLKVSEITALRRKLREVGAEYKVVKNTLFELAIQDKADSEVAKLLEGPTAVAFVHNDAIAPAKAIVDFMREHKAPALKGGFVDGQVCSADQIQTLSRIPPRDVLVAQLLGAVQSPLANLVGTLQGTLSSLVYTLQAVVDKKAA